MGNLSKQILTAIKTIAGRPADVRKFFDPIVGRGKTVWPKTAANLERYVSSNKLASTSKLRLSCAATFIITQRARKVLLRTIPMIPCWPTGNHQINVPTTQSLNQSTCLPASTTITLDPGIQEFP